MTAIKSPKPPLSRKSIAGQALFAVALLLVARFLWMRDRPERLTYPLLGNFKIAGDKLYMTIRSDWMPPDQDTIGQGENTVQAQSIHSADRRLIGREDKNVQFYTALASDTSTIADGKLYYAVIPRPQLPSSPTGFGGKTAAPGSNLVNFVPPSKHFPDPGGVGPGRVGAAPAPPPTQKIRFRQVSLQGGTPQDVASLQGENFCLVGMHVFWIQPGPEELPQVVPPVPAPGKQGTPRGALMLTSLADGTTRRIYSGIPRATTLVLGDSGVAWKEAAPSSGRPKLFYASGLDGSVHALGTRAQNDQNPPRYVEFEGRLYWPVIVAEVEGNANFHSVLMSADLDGADVREVCARVDKRRIENLWLSVHRGSLYGCLSEVSSEIEDRSKSTQFLCRLYPDRSDPIEIVRKLPGTSRQYQFDGGYLYFSYVELKRGLWANLTGDDTYTPVAEMLFRVPLDH